MTSSASTAAWLRAASVRPGLGADRDRRHVMGDRVVQLARQLLALAEPDLVALALSRELTR